MTQKTAQNLGDALQMMQQQQAASERAEEAREAPAGAGLLVAPGVRFSERLLAKLRDKTHEADRQSRRERMTQTTSLPAPRFDAEFRRDAIWKQRELRIRQAYVQHLEKLALQKDEEKEALATKMMHQVSGVYKQAQDDAISRLADNTAALMAKTVRTPGAKSVCQAETEAALQCYKANTRNPLACWDMVAAFEACARRARQDA
eukprot:Tamp_24478.p2 GENE.Tamp_24478~~Tamp_24478.p2  ORF type:complete len:204 (+),score=58.90 Tamp_24478:291-902(+)